MIALITPTGARPRQIVHCAQYMKAQKYTGKVLWVIVDDADPITTDFIGWDFRHGWEIVKIYPRPLWRPGLNTQNRNLREAVQYVQTREDVEAVFIIEDDDWYSPVYIQKMLPLLDGYDVGGETKTIYYNVTEHVKKENHNIYHASLFQTVIHPRALDVFLKTLDEYGKYIDINFFRKALKINLSPGPYLSIGIKGLEGRPGIGMGHKLKGIKRDQMPSLKQIMELKNLIGLDYLNYI